MQNEMLLFPFEIYICILFKFDAYNLCTNSFRWASSNAGNLLSFFWLHNSPLDRSKPAFHTNTIYIFNSCCYRWCCCLLCSFALKTIEALSKRTTHHLCWIFKMKACFRYSIDYPNLFLKLMLKFLNYKMQAQKKQTITIDFQFGLFFPAALLFTANFL